MSLAFVENCKLGTGTWKVQETERSVGLKGEDKGKDPKWSSRGPGYPAGSMKDFYPEKRLISKGVT